MIRNLLWLLMVELVAPVLGSSGAEPLKVARHLSPGPYFVGQAIEIEVEVEVEGVATEWRFEPPKSSVFEFHALTVDPAKPSTGRFVAIPKRSGTLDLGSFRAKGGDRSGGTRPSKLTVGNLPAEGRGSAFLGGVGAFEIKAVAEPTMLRLGQTLEFRLKLSGPAAWGSLRPPDLSGWASIGEDLRVVSLPTEQQGVEPPLRTFRYQIRPRGAGNLVLPPVAVASFDPKTGRFLTRTSSSVAIAVEKPPTLDPDSLDYRPVARQSDSRNGWTFVGLGLGVAGLLALGLWWLDRKRRRGKPANPSKLALELARQLSDSAESEPARRVVEALTRYLERIQQRSPGVLTPPEAREAFGSLTSEPVLAEQAERLVMACDRDQFGRRSDDPSRVLDDGRAFFERVAKVMGRKERAEEGPREAVEIA